MIEKMLELTELYIAEQNQKLTGITPRTWKIIRKGNPACVHFEIDVVSYQGRRKLEIGTCIKCGRVKEYREDMNTNTHGSSNPNRLNKVFGIK